MGDAGETIASSGGPTSDVTPVPAQATEPSSHDGDGASPPSSPAERVPKYYRLKQALRMQIDGLPPGTALRPERALSAEFNASRATVRQALMELAVEGRIVRMQGRGTFVSPPKDTLPLQLRSYTEEWQARGRSPSSRLIDIRTEPADAEVATQLEIAADTAVTRIERLRLTDGIPMALEIVHLEESRFTGLREMMSDDVSLYQLLRDQWDIHPQTAQQTIETIMASPSAAAQLDTEPGTPVLLLNRCTRATDGRAFEFVRSLYRGDRYRFVTTLSRP